MLSTLLGASALTLGLAGAAPATLEADHGDLPWFEGSWEELLAKAQAEERLVFVDFWADWCGWCKKLDQETFTDEAVVAAMEGFLVYSVDTESEAGAPVAERYGVGPLPTLLFLEPDGSVRDTIVGFLPPEPFAAEVARIERNEDTLSGYRDRVEADPDDLEARYGYAQKLESVGDVEGAEAQRAEILARDPEFKTLPARRLRFETALAKAQDTLDPAPIYALAEGETDRALLFDEWYVLWQLERIHTGRADEEGDEARAMTHRGKWIAAARAVWSHVAAEDVASFGNQLAWSLWEAREDIGSDDKAFALLVAAKAREAAPDDASVVDTHGAALFMNGRVDEAIAAARRAIELEPDNEEWRARLAMYEEQK